ncbi:MAG: hypothetical protein H6711_00355 [Myxococcales bacterium]|nr:hypothetical protein [Myxococcales bacterium]
METPARVLVIGETILNQTLRVEPALLGRGAIPVAFLNEELTHLRAPPDWSLQGAGYIARFLADARPGRSVTLLTETRNHVFPGMIRQMLSGIGDPARSIFAIEDRSAPVVTRILRNVAASRTKGPQPDYRPQLRIDTPSAPLPPGEGRGPAIGAALDGVFAHLEAGDRCLLRSSTREFLGGYAAPDPGPAIAAILERALARGVRVVLDLRPIPRDLEIRDPETIVCTTIGRLEDAYGRVGDDLEARGELVARAFWRLTPARALICFGADAGVWVAVRGPRMSAGELLRIPVTWPIEQGDGCGMVVGGDAFVAALVDALERGEGPVEAARAAAAALAVAMQGRLGEPISAAQVAAELASIPAARGVAIEDPAGEPVLRLAARIADGSAEPLWEGLVAPAGGAMRAYFSELRRIFEEWTPRPGRDLVAIFGESRSGKEFPLKVALKGLGLGILGPVNMHQFLAETGGVITELQRRSEAHGRPLALVIDEVVPDDASRSLLNLTAEKLYRRWGTLDAPLSFRDNPVVLLSSIDPDRLLRDMQGRLCAAVRVPPLRRRQDEIPFLLPMVVREALGDAVASITRIEVSARMMAALLAHDYRPIDGAATGFGLDQQNFRALADLVGFVGRGALAAGGDPALLALRAAYLPRALRHLAQPTLADEGGFVYAPPFDRPGIPTPPQA